MKYRVTVHFTYKNGEAGGLLDSVVRGRKTADFQLDANYKWLAAKGHTPTKTSVTPVTN